MANSTSLKDRFNQLQTRFTKKTDDVVAEATAKVPSEEVTPKLSTSSNPALHTELRASGDKGFDWKKILRDQTVRLKMGSELPPSFTVIQKTLNSISKRPLILTFVHAAEIETTQAELLASFIRRESRLFELAVSFSTSCVLRFSKGRPIIEFDGHDSTSGKEIADLLEDACQKNGAVLRSFQVETKNGWLSMNLNITDKLFRSVGEINV